MLPVKLANESFTTVTSSGSITGVYDVYFVDATVGDITLTLPLASEMLLGRNISFRRVDGTGNTVTLDTGGVDTMNGPVSVTGTDVTTVMVISTTGWRSFVTASGESSTSFTTLDSNAVVTGDYDTYFVDATNGGIILTLATAANVGVGRTLTFKRTDSSFNTVTIQRAGTDTIDGGTSVALGATEILTLLVLTTTSWRSMAYEGAVGTMPISVITGTTSISGAADLYIISIAADAIITLPEASTMAPYRKISFRRTDSTNFSATLQAGGADTFILTNTLAATSTTINSADVVDLVRTGLAGWTLSNARPSFRNFSPLQADAAVTVNTNFDVWRSSDTLGADRAYTLPLAAAAGFGRILTISNRAPANNVIVTRAGADTINGALTTLNIGPNTAGTFMSDGVSNWSRIG